jgi:hypothetical protein
MSIVNQLIRDSEASRVAELERRSTGEVISGDFSGSVTAQWVQLASNGAGIVTYNNKQYTTKPLGFTSIAKNQEVELSFANGVYYSNW